LSNQNRNTAATVVPFSFPANSKSLIKVDHFFKLA